MVSFEGLLCFVRSRDLEAGRAKAGQSQKSHCVVQQSNETWPRKEEQGNGSLILEAWV